MSRMPAGLALARTDEDTGFTPVSS
jgi:hypothetical protein